MKTCSGEWIGGSGGHREHRGPCGAPALWQDDLDVFAYCEEHCPAEDKARYYRRKCALLAAALGGLPRCDHFVKYHDAMGGQECCDRPATKRGRLRASYSMQREHRVTCDEHADELEGPADHLEGPVDLSWAEAVREAERTEE